MVASSADFAAMHQQLPPRGGRDLPYISRHCFYASSRMQNRRATAISAWHGNKRQGGAI